MKMKVIFALAATAAAALVGSARADVLPGYYSILSSPTTVRLAGHSVRDYFSAFWLQNATTTGAILRRADNAGWLPACGYTESNKQGILALGQLKAEIFNGSQLLWRSCSTSLGTLNNGDKFILANYPGGWNWNNTRNAQLYVNLFLPLEVYPQPWATEWKLW